MQHYHSTMSKSYLSCAHRCKHLIAEYFNSKLMTRTAETSCAYPATFCRRIWFSKVKIESSLHLVIDLKYMRSGRPHLRPGYIIVTYWFYTQLSLSFTLDRIDCLHSFTSITYLHSSLILSSKNTEQQDHLQVQAFIRNGQRQSTVPAFEARTSSAWAPCCCKHRYITFSWSY